MENIREITTSVYTQPVESEYKVYILDEVHMLSKAAFNAFLKTLEEPPKHAVFILVTTEEEKVPETVASRCVALQFRQPSIDRPARHCCLNCEERGVHPDKPVSRAHRAHGGRIIP